jgi:putative methyltransferase
MSREYLCAAKVLDAILSKKLSLKSYCSSHKVGKTDYALTVETMKYLSVLRQVYSRASVTAKSLDVGGEGIMYVMGYELLFGKKKIRGGGAVKRIMMATLPALQAALSAILAENPGTGGVADLIPLEVKQSIALPKYIRMNLLKVPAAACWQEINEQFAPLHPVLDSIIPNLVVLPADTRGLGQHEMVASNKVIIQDKASCMPSQILFDAYIEFGYAGYDIIDACAAPGNKTSHVASLLHEYRQHQQQLEQPSRKQRLNEEGAAENVVSSRIFAFDKSPTRCALLERRIKAAGADEIVTVRNQDFLTVEFASPTVSNSASSSSSSPSATYSNVRAILLDPSCSGSGVARALDRMIEDTDNRKDEEDEQKRIQSLAAFQLSAVLHAMNNDNIQLITYSTCSIHKEENEQVVASALSQQQPNPLFGRWRLSEPTRMKSWTSRGIPCEELTMDEQQKLIRCYPGEGLNGFFVSLFVRDRISNSDGTMGDLAGKKRKSPSELPKTTELGVEREQQNPGTGRARPMRIWKPLHRFISL